MAYTPPIGSVTLNLSRRYTQPIGSVTLSLHDPSNARLLEGAARTAGATALASISTLNRMIGATRTAGVMANGALAQSLNLPPLLALSVSSDWAALANPGRATAPNNWRAASPLRRAAEFAWTDAPRQTSADEDNWRAASPLRRAAEFAWTDAPRQTSADEDNWRAASPLRRAAEFAWTDAPRRAATGQGIWAAVLSCLMRILQDAWTQAHARALEIREFWGDGPALRGREIGQWGDAIGPANTRKSAIVPPPGIRPPRINWATPIILNLHRPLLEGMPILLNLGADPRPFTRAPVRRVYRMLTNLQIVRLPERTPIPATGLSLQTDFDSWGWALDLTLAGPDGWALCQPIEGMPVECEITINDITWIFMLDDPQLTRKFESGYDIRAHGISRAGWLTTPWTPSETIQYENARSARQIADEALDGTGWALEWELPDDPQWLIPGGTYARAGTILDRLRELVAAVNGGLYCDPLLPVLTARPRYPAPPWLWDSTPPEISIPESALLSWNQSPDSRPAINRVYVGGTTQGVLLQLTRAGTAGDRCPNEPILDSLLTDVYAARARGMAELAGSGPGVSVTVETLLGDGVPLIRPGDLVEFAGMRGINRSTRVRIESSSGLAVGVIQELTLERRIGPWQ